MLFRPSDEEVLAAVRWVLTQDAAAVFPTMVLETVRALGYRHIVTRL
jgi:hypothetical protein